MNEYSGYDVMTTDDYIEPRGIRKGDVEKWQFCSYVDPHSHKPLSWREFALELGLFEEFLLPDGHDCKKCPNRKNCIAYFKDDEKQATCDWWKKNKEWKQNEKK